MVKNRTKQTSQHEAKPNAGASSVIVTFRIPLHDFTQLSSRLNDHPIVGVKSVHQLARKLLVDVINHRYLKLG